MDILNTEVVWIEGRCYRKLPIETDGNVEKSVDIPRTRTRDPEEYMNNTCDIDNLPIKHEGDRFFITIPVPSPLVGFVQGKQGAKRKQIEDQTGTTIKIPPVRKTDSKDADIDIAIFGRHKENVATAYNRIQYYAQDARWKLGDYTHFLSIPVNSESIQKGFNNFKKEVLAKYKDRGVTEYVFESSPKLHLTIGMLTLLNGREKEAAKSLLQTHKKDIINILGGKSLNIEVKGVEYMNDDPSEVDVLYGMVRETDSDNCLQLIADKLADVFAIANFSRREKDPDQSTTHVKLHVTLMKSRIVEGQPRPTFDARKILKSYADYTFGQMTIREIHISVRYTGGHTSYYTSTFVLDI